MNLPFIVMAVGTVATLGYVVGTRQPADVYAMPMNEVYAKLVKVDFGPPEGAEDVLHTKKTARGNGSNRVTWTQIGDMAAFECKMDLAPLPDDAAKTHVTVTCGGGGAGDGAAAGMVHNMMRNAYIERVDATLTGRPFDKQLAVGSTASGWPDDGVDGSLATAQVKALEMDAEMRRQSNR
jgi:hypothetical protein